MCYSNVKHTSVSVHTRCGITNHLYSKIKIDRLRVLEQGLSNKLIFLQKALVQHMKARVGASGTGAVVENLDAYRAEMGNFLGTLVYQNVLASRHMQTSSASSGAATPSSTISMAQVATLFSLIPL